MSQLKLQKVILEKDLPAVTGLQKTQIAAKVADGSFPKPVKLSERRRAWLEAEVLAWQIARIAERDQKAK